MFTTIQNALAAAIVLLVLAGGCSSESDENETSGQGLEPAAAKALVARAAAVPALALEDLFRLGANVRPEDLHDCPFTLVVMCVSPAQAKSEDLRWPRLGAATTPQDYSPGILSLDDKWKSLLNEKTIREVTCESGPDEATGTVAFACSDIIEGKLRFRARRTAKGWEVFELTVPASSLRNFLGEDGRWRFTVGE